MLTLSLLRRVVKVRHRRMCATKARAEESTNVERSDHDRRVCQTSEPSTSTQQLRTTEPADDTSSLSAFIFNANTLPTAVLDKTIADNYHKYLFPDESESAHEWTTAEEPMKVHPNLSRSWVLWRFLLEFTESYHSLLKYLNADLPRPLNDDEKERLRVPPRAFSLAPYMNHSSVLRKMVQIGVDL